MKLISLIIFLITAISCGAGEDSDNSPSSSDGFAGGFINASQFQADDSVRDLTAEEVALSIRGVDFVYLTTNKAQASLTADAAANCAVKRDEIVVSNEGLEMFYQFDDSTCTDLDDPYINKMRIFISVSCSGQDMSNFSEGSVRQHIYTKGAADFCPDAKEQRTFINAELTRESSTQTATVIGGVMTPGGGSCLTKKEGDEISVNDCTFFQKTTKSSKSSDEVETTNLISFKSQDLKGSVGALYYNTGSMQITVNNWQGTLSYSADNVGPTYEIKSGEDIIEGSFKGGITSR